MINDIVFIDVIFHFSPPLPSPPLPSPPQRIATITSTLQSHLEDSFRTSLEQGDREGLTRSLQTYTTISRQQAAEGMFQSLIVHPYMEKVALSNEGIKNERSCSPQIKEHY